MPPHTGVDNGVTGLVTLRLNGTPVAQRDKGGRRPAELLALLRTRPDGAQYTDIYAALGNSGIKALDRLVVAGEVLRPSRGRYVAAQPTDPERPKVPGGVTANGGEHAGGAVGCARSRTADPR